MCQLTPISIAIPFPFHDSTHYARLTFFVLPSHSLSHSLPLCLLWLTTTATAKSREKAKVKKMQSKHSRRLVCMNCASNKAETDTHACAVSFAHTVYFTPAIPFLSVLHLHFTCLSSSLCLHLSLSLYLSAPLPFSNSFTSFLTSFTYKFVYLIPPILLKLTIASFSLIGVYTSIKARRVPIPFSTTFLSRCGYESKFSFSLGYIFN